MQPILKIILREQAVLGLRFQDGSTKELIHSEHFGLNFLFSVLTVSGKEYVNDLMKSIPEGPESSIQKLFLRMVGK